MKVAMLTYSTKARGGVAHALKLAERLKASGLDVTLYSLAREDDPVARKGYFREVTVPYEVFTYEWSSDLLTRLERMIECYVSNLPTDADIFHAQDCVGGTSLARMKEKGMIKGPIFRTVHHVDDFADPLLFRFERAAVEHADHRFVVSKYWQDSLYTDYGYESVVTYNGLDLEDFSDLPERISRVPTVLFVGGLEPRKGLEYLVLAMHDVAKEVPEARLTVVGKTGFRGTDEVEWFETLAERAGVAGMIDFHESVSQDTLIQMYADCDLLVLPSRNEGWGLALMEAMACGKPVVATRVGGIPELVADGEEGILVPQGDAKGMSAAIVRLLKDPGLRDRMGEAGRRRVTEFSWDDTARVVARAYSTALQAR